jgi:hypothetical protein
MDRFSSQIRAAMEALQRCHTICLATAMTYCLGGEGAHRRPQHIRLMLDGAAACRFAGDLLAHKSQFHNGVCALCADICETCAADCEKLGQMDDCVAACREVADLCGVIAKLEHGEILAMAARLPPG